MLYRPIKDTYSSSSSSLRLEVIIGLGELEGIMLCESVGKNLRLWLKLYTEYPCFLVDWIGVIEREREVILCSSQLDCWLDRHLLFTVLLAM